jgi:imidazolonepropionase-like amidohydrolase
MTGIASPLRTATLAGLLALSAPAPAAAPAAPLAITEVTIVDVEHGTLSRPRTVVVELGRIVAIDAPRRARLPAGARRIDGRGRYLVPGLVDMHVHLFNNATHRPPNDWAFPLFVAHGVTAVREMAARVESLPQVAAWNAARANGTLVAPRVVAAAVVVRGDSPPDAARDVLAAADAGADAIKVFSELPAANLPAILAAARMRGLSVIGHAPARLPLRDAAGLRSNEHLMQVFEACSPLEDELVAARRDVDDDALAQLQAAQEARALATYSPARCRRVARRLAAAGQAQVPTLVLDALPRDGRHAQHPLWPRLREDERARWQRLLGSLAPDDRAAERARRQVARRIVAALHREHVLVLAGTDTPMPESYPGDSLHEELRLLVEAGFTPAQALRAATLDPARFLGQDADSGTVAVGKRADLVLLAADPTRHIGNARRIEAVVLDGRLLDRAALDGLLHGTP